MDINLTPERIFANNAAARAIMVGHVHSLANGVRPAVTMNGVTHPAHRRSFSESVDRARALRAAVYQGHAGEGGLQKHSVGGLYPWAVVSFGDGTHTVANLATGKQLRCRFRDYDIAAEWAEQFKEGGDNFFDVDRFLGTYTYPLPVAQ